MAKSDLISDNQKHLRPETIICLLLFLTILIVYWEVKNFEFIALDDSGYILENRAVKEGIHWNGIKWAFSSPGLSYWHPLTWISHMLDCELYGLNSGMHHRTNLILHICSTLLLFLMLRKITSAVWQSALVAFLFGLHPVNVESVAWVAERKNLLSTFFWFLTMGCYAYYVDKERCSRYAITLGVFILGLLSKPMLVTLPFVLLLLDFWPLRRFESPVNSASNSKVVKEKIPFFLLSGLSIFISAFSVQDLGISVSTEAVPMNIRIANAVVSYVRYIGKLLWPDDLAVFYPYPTSIPFWQWFFAAALLIFISTFVFRMIEKKPFFAVGWFWFLGTLVPVLGLKQAGTWPAMADRWLYVPSIGIFIAFSWGIFDLFKEWRFKKIGITILFSLIIPTLMMVTQENVSYWRNSITLFRHALEVNSENYIAHYNLADAIRKVQGKVNEVAHHYSEAIRINPENVGAYNDFGVYLLTQGQTDRGIHYLTKALEFDPTDAEVHNNIGFALAGQGKFTEAVRHLKTALQIDPHFSLAEENLQTVLEAKAQGSG